MEAVAFSWDEAKRQQNLSKHGVDFSQVEGFDFDEALITVDARRDYGESRYRAFGNIGDRLHTLVFTLRDDTIRVISLRKSNDREAMAYAKATA